MGSCVRSRIAGSRSRICVADGLAPASRSTRSTHFRNSIPRSSAATFADYAIPGASEVPVLRIDHMETPSPYTRFGQKGIGEGGAIGPPAAIANAVNDALAGIGARVDRLPITAQRVMAAVMAAEAVS